MSLTVLYILYFIAYCCLNGTAGALISEHRGNSRHEGFVIGFLLGFFGLAVIALKSRGPDHIAPPAGFYAVRCFTCNAVQNISNADADYECWQCHRTTVIRPSSDPDENGRCLIGCPTCGTALKVPLGSRRFTCLGCSTRINAVI
jgi:hypothetical protein